MVSCDGLFGVENNVGKPIKFGTGRQTTRVYYPNIYDGLMKWEDGDKVSIYMYWKDFNGKNFGPEKGNYHINHDTDDGRQSYGYLVADGESLRWQGEFGFGDGRAHEYNHTFISAYPKRDLNNDRSYSFNLPASQNGSTQYMYMTAYEEDVTSKENWVYLRYFPAVTTLVVTINNDANIDLGSTLKLKSTQPISGSYNVDPSNRSVSVTNGNREVTVPMKVGEPMMFFIIPQVYDANLNFEIDNGSSWLIDKTLSAAGKYIITIKTTERKPDVDGPFSSFVNGVVLAEAHKRGKNWQWGWVDGEQKIFWNNPDNYNNWEPVPDELLWEIINTIVDIDYTGSWEITEITREDLNIFPNVKTVNINASNLTSIDVSNPNITELNITSEAIHTVKVEGCDSLKTFDISSKNNIADVVVKGNKILEYFTMSGPAGAGVNITCDSCPVLEWFSLTGGEGWNFPFHKDIINCPMFDESKVNVPGCKEY